MPPITLQKRFRVVFYAALARGDHMVAKAVTLRIGTIWADAKDAVLAGVADLAWGGPMRIQPFAKRWCGGDVRLLLPDRARRGPALSSRG